MLLLFISKSFKCYWCGTWNRQAEFKFLQKLFCPLPINTFGKGINPSPSCYDLNNKADWDLLSWLVANLRK